MDESEAKPSEEFLQFELQQAIETVRHHAGIIVQVTGFFVALDSALLAYGIIQGKAILTLMAALVPALLAFIHRDVRYHAAPFAYVALQLEATLHGGQTALIATYVRTQMPKLYEQISPLASLQPPAVIDHQIMRKFRRGFWNQRMQKVLIALCAIQLAGFVVDVTVFHQQLV